MGTGTAMQYCSLQGTERLPSAAGKRGVHLCLPGLDPQLSPPGGRSCVLLQAQLGLEIHTMEQQSTTKLL